MNLIAWLVGSQLNSEGARDYMQLPRLAWDFASFVGKSCAKSISATTTKSISTSIIALSPNDDVKMSTTQKTQKPKAGRSAIADVVAREYTIHLHKRVRSV